MTASADQILGAIKSALGNPTSGAFVDYWGVIDEAVRESLGEPSPAKDAAGSKATAKETRIIKATETPEDATT
jgi:hypothetical protein